MVCIYFFFAGIYYTIYYSKIWIPAVEIPAEKDSQDVFRLYFINNDFWLVMGRASRPKKLIPGQSQSQAKSQSWIVWNSIPTPPNMDDLGLCPGMA